MYEITDVKQANKYAYIYTAKKNMIIGRYLHSGSDQGWSIDSCWASMTIFFF